MILRTSIAIVGMLVAVVGCRQQSPHAGSEAKLAKYAELTLTSQSHDRELQAELALLRAERMLPAMVDADCKVASATEAPSGELTNTLNTVFTASQLPFARERSDTMFERGVDQWNPLALERALQFRAACLVPLEKVQQAMATRSARLQLPLAAGPAPDLRCVDAALICVRLECIAAADALSHGDGRESLAAITRALRLVELLDAQPHVATRLTAATARADALSGVQCFVNSRLGTTVHLGQLERLISQQLATWPPDADMWIGDRAIGLCTYEMIRDGQLVSVLTVEELTALREREGVATFATAVTKNVDADEMHYLRAMRRIIDACRLPHLERAAAIELLNQERRALAHSPQYPIIADRVLLVGVEEGLRQQAADLALARAWGIALAVACGASLPPPEINPLTGDTYDVRIANDHVIVAAIDPLDPQLQVTAPIASAVQISSRRAEAPEHQPR